MSTPPAPPLSATPTPTSTSGSGVTASPSPTSTSGSGVTASASPIAPTTQTPVAGLTFQATAGVISPPFTTTNGIVSQIWETSISDGGRASYSFNIAAPGDYIVRADVYAPPSKRGNAFFVNIDAGPTGRTMIWDILQPTAGIETRYGRVAGRWSHVARPNFQSRFSGYPRERTS